MYKKVKVGKLFLEVKKKFWMNIRMDRHIAEWLVESLLASSKARLKRRKGNQSDALVSGSPETLAGVASWKRNQTDITESAESTYFHHPRGGFPLCEGVPRKCICLWLVSQHGGTYTWYSRAFWLVRSCCCMHVGTWIYLFWIRFLMCPRFISVVFSTRLLFVVDFVSSRPLVLNAVKARIFVSLHKEDPLLQLSYRRCNLLAQKQCN